MLVPSGQPGAAAMLERHSRSRGQRFRQAVVARAVTAGLLPLLPVWRVLPAKSGDGTASIDGYVRMHLPRASAVGVLLGPPRANAKPVLRIFDDCGTTIAFGKVGHNELSAALVRHEHQVLHELSGADFAHLEIPQVLHFGTWHGLTVLLVSALQTAGRSEPSWQLPLAACVELAEQTEITTADVARSSYLQRLSRRTAALGQQSAVRDQVDAAVATIATTELSFGRWHGDWAPWNMGAGNDPVQLWDWERSQDDVPLGFDIVHFLAQQTFMARTPAPAALTTIRDGAADAMRRWDLGRHEVDATVLLYLCEILVRYTADAGASPSPALRNRIDAVTTMLTLLGERHPKEFHVDA